MLIMDYGLAFARANVGVPRIAGGITSFSGHSNPPDVISSEIGGIGMGEDGGRRVSINLAHWTMQMLIWAPR